MEKAADILGAAMRRMQQPEAILAWLAGTWTTIVGDQLASHTRPVALSGGMLQIRTNGVEWQRQLEPMSQQFCEKINRAWGGGLVHKLSFTAVSPAPGVVPKAEDNRHTPFVRRRGE